MNLKHLLITMLLLALVVPGVVGENVTYPQEYYTLGEQSDSLTSYITMDYFKKYQFTATTEGLISAIELRRQTILMEKQNEMIYQQNMWQRNAKLECTSMVGAVGCYEYAWVGGA